MSTNHILSFITPSLMHSSAFMQSAMLDDQRHANHFSLYFDQARLFTSAPHKTPGLRRVWWAVESRAKNYNKKKQIFWPSLHVKDFFSVISFFSLALAKI